MTDAPTPKRKPKNDNSVDISHWLNHPDVLAAKRLAYNDYTNKKMQRLYGEKFDRDECRYCKHPIMKPGDPGYSASRPDRVEVFCAYHRIQDILRVLKRHERNLERNRRGICARCSRPVSSMFRENEQERIGKHKTDGLSSCYCAECYSRKRALTKLLSLVRKAQFDKQHGLGPEDIYLLDDEFYFDSLIDEP